MQSSRDKSLSLLGREGVRHLLDLDARAARAGLYGVGLDARYVCMIR